MSEQRYRNLFSPFKLRGLTIPNRLVMPAMETSLGDAEGAVTAAEIAYYRARAEGGMGMIIVEACSVHGASGRILPHNNCLDSPRFVDGHRHLVEAITNAGAVACLQLFHGGIQADRMLVADGMPTGPSEERSPTDGSLQARALSESEIERLIECFGQAAQLAVQAGYQAIELHGAHGYLVSTFLSPATNHREDAWGGDEQRRLNFPCRVLQRIRQAIGERPLTFRLSAAEFIPNGLTIEDVERIALRLVAAGADALNVSTGTMLGTVDKVVDPVSASEGWRIPYASRIRKAAKVPVIAVGPFRQPAMAEKAIREGDVDLVALGRPMLADPEWANKTRRGAEQSIRPCISCNYCVRGNPAIICSVNPHCGRELEERPAHTHGQGQRAVVIGGGPGGMAAALMLDQTGFRTELYEARPMLGGGLIASSAVQYKASIARYQHYLERRLHESGVTIKLGVQADISMLTGAKPAIAVLATGGNAVRLPIAGIDCDFVHDAYDALMGDESWQPQSRALPIVVYGGGETGCETAEYCINRDYDVVLVTRSPSSELARSAEWVYRGVLRKSLAENTRLRIVEKTTITSVSEDGAVALESWNGTRTTLNASRVLIAQGRKPDLRLAEELAEADIPFVVIGDARRGGRIGDAVHDAYAAVMSICVSSLDSPRLSC